MTATRSIPTPSLSRVDTRVVKALAHPLRLKVIQHLQTREKASPNELSEIFDVPLGTMSYHVRRLHDLGFLELVKRVPRRGAVEHFYRLKKDVDGALRGMADRIGGLQEGERTSTTVVLDPPAAETFTSEMGAVLDRLRELADESAARQRAGASADTISIDLIYGIGAATSSGR